MLSLLPLLQLNGRMACINIIKDRPRQLRHKLQIQTMSPSRNLKCEWAKKLLSNFLGRLNVKHIAVDIIFYQHPPHLHLQFVQQVVYHMICDEGVHRGCQCNCAVLMPHTLNTDTTTTRSTGNYFSNSCAFHAVLANEIPKQISHLVQLTDVQRIMHAKRVEHCCFTNAESILKSAC